MAFPILDLIIEGTITLQGSDITALLNNLSSSVNDYDNHIASTANPHSVTKSQVGLGNVPNTDTSTTANITDSTDKRFVTNSEKTAITHANRSTLDAIQESLTTALKAAYDSTVTWISTNSSNLLNHLSNTSNPHSTTAAQVGAYTTSQTDTQISSAISTHASALDPHPQYETSTEAQAKVDTHANLTNNPHAVTKAQVGLGNVDNTSDANKPVSTATQTALNLKYDASNPNGYETPTQLNTRDTNNRNRANHTGTQTASTISDFAATVRSTVLTSLGAFTNVAISAADSILSAMSKLQGQINTKANISGQVFTGSISATNLSGNNTGDQDLSSLMVKANNLSDLTNTTTARTNLGLGTLATQSGTFSGTSSGVNTGDETTATIQTKRPLKTINGSSLEGVGNIVIAGGGGSTVSFFTKRLESNQSTTANTPISLVGQSFEIPPGHCLTIWGNLIYTSASTSTGASYGLNVQQATGADANAVGSFLTYVNLASTPAATGLSDGDVINVAQNSNTNYMTLGTSSATVGGNNSAFICATIYNLSTNGTTFITMAFNSETNGTAVTAQANSSVTAILGLIQ